MVKYIDRTRYRKSYRDVVDFYKRFVKNYPFLPSHPILGLSFEDQTNPVSDLSLLTESGEALQTESGEDLLTES